MDISKIKINNDYYDIKDEELRKAIDKLIGKKILSENNKKIGEHDNI